MNADDVIVINNKVCISSSALADLFNVSVNTVSVWKQQGCPQEARNAWSIKDVLTWKGIFKNGKMHSQEEINNMALSEQKTYYEIELKKVQRDTVEIRNDISRGKYILTVDVIADLQRYFIVLKRSLLLLPKKIGNELSCYLDPLEARRIENFISDTILDCLDQLSISGVYNAKK